MKAITNLVLVTILIQSVLSCTCIRESFQQKYCGSDLSVRGRVLAAFDNCPGKCNGTRLSFDDDAEKDIYIVKVLNVFQGPPVKNNTLYVSTALFNTCSVSLIIDKEYLFNFNMISKKTNQRNFPPESFPLNLCSPSTGWDSLDKKDREFVWTNSKTNQSLCANVSLPFSSTG